MASYINKHGKEILVDSSGWKISRKNAEKKAAQQAAKVRKCPDSLLKELESAIQDGESQEYIDYLKGKIANYKG